MEVNVVIGVALEPSQSWGLINPFMVVLIGTKNSEQTPKFLKNSCNISWQELQTEIPINPFPGV